LHVLLTFKTAVQANVYCRVKLGNLEPDYIYLLMMLCCWKRNLIFQNGQTLILFSILQWWAVFFLCCCCLWWGCFWKWKCIL